MSLGSDARPLSVKQQMGNNGNTKEVKAARKGTGHPTLPHKAKVSSLACAPQHTDRILDLPLPLPLWCLEGCYSRQHVVNIGSNEIPGNIPGSIKVCNSLQNIIRDRKTRFLKIESGTCSLIFTRKSRAWGNFGRQPVERLRNDR